MILSTHAIVGGAIASLIPSHPLLAFAAGFASHFAIDAIPHWDYQLRSIRVGRGADNRRLSHDRAFAYDITLICADATAGLVLAMLFFASSETAVAIVLGAIGGILPDPLQFIHSLRPSGPLKPLQRFHGWVHSNKRVHWQLGVTSQAGLALGVTLLALWSH
jgi:hypothetical protein